MKLTLQDYRWIKLYIQLKRQLNIKRLEYKPWDSIGNLNSQLRRQLRDQLYYRIRYR